MNKDITLDMLDDDSKEFIEWSMNKWEDTEWRIEFLRECVHKFQNYISRDPNELKAALKQKFILGGYEHGSPAKYTKEQVDREVEFEYQDAIGWPFVYLYAEWKRNRGRTT